MDESLTPTTVAATAVTDQRETKNSSAQPSGHNSLSASTPTIHGLTDVALTFLSNASNETLGACAIGLCATTYFVLGRVGLVLIGTVAGVVLHATWEGSQDGGDGNHGASQKTVARRKELGIEVAKRVLDWKDKRKGPESETEEESLRVEGSIIRTVLDFSDFKPETGAALTSLTDAVIRDYVKYVQLEIALGCMKY